MVVVVSYFIIPIKSWAIWKEEIDRLLKENKHLCTCESQSFIFSCQKQFISFSIELYHSTFWTLVNVEVIGKILCSKCFSIWQQIAGHIIKMKMRNVVDYQCNPF